MPKLVAIDQGSHSVKAAVYRTVGRGVELIGRFHQPVPQSGEEVTAEQRQVALEVLLEEHVDWSVNTTSIVSWPGTKATFKYMVLPFTDQAKIEQTLPFAVEGEVPFEMDDMLLGHRVLSKTDRTELLIVIADEEAVTGCVEMFNQHKMDPSSIVVDADTAGAWGHDGRVVAVVDAGHQHTTVSVVVDGAVHSCRTISVAGAHFTRAIQQALDCEWSAAEAIKHGEALPTNDDEPVISGMSDGLPPEAVKAIEGVTGLFLASVRASLIAAEDQLGCEIEEVCFTGGTSRMSMLWDFLGRDLGVPVRRINDANGDPIPGAFAVAEALAYQQTGLAPEGIDLRVGTLAFKGSTDALRAMLTYGTASIGCFLAAALVLFIVQSGQLNQEREQTDALLTEMVGQTFPDITGPQVEDPTLALSVLREQTVAAVDRAEVLSDEDTEPFVVGTLLDLTEALPAHPQVVLQVDNLNLSRKVLAFQAKLESESAYAMAEEIVTSLQKSERFNRVKSGEDGGGRTTRTFKWTIPLVDEAVEEEG